MRLEILAQRIVQFEAIAKERDEVDRHVVFLQKRLNRLDGHLDRLRLGVAVYARGDQGKGHARAVMFSSQPQRIAVTGRQKRPLAVPAAPPDGAGRMDDIPAGEAVPARDLGLAGGSAVQRRAFLQKLRPCRAVNRAVHAAAAQQRGVRGVDDGVHGHPGDVVLNKQQGHRSHPPLAGCEGH